MMPRAFLHDYQHMRRTSCLLLMAVTIYPTTRLHIEFKWKPNQPRGKRYVRTFSRFIYIYIYVCVCVCIYLFIYVKLGRGSSVGMATDYGLEVRDRFPLGTRFSARPDRPWSPPSLQQNGYRVFPGGKVRPERAADHSPPSSAAVMEQ